MTALTDPNLFRLTRPDGRKVYHLGILATGNGPLPADGDMTKTYHLGPYTEGAINVPGHWWNAEVTDRTNCPIPPTTAWRTPAQLVAANRMFPYGDTGVKVQAQGPRVPYTQMGSSNITIGMGQTGERADIGLITDNSAYYMLGQDPTPMIDWALAAGSCPMHFRDETTDRPIDLIKYWSANAYDGAGYMGSPWLPKGPAIPATGKVYLADGVTLDKNDPGYNPGSAGYTAWGGGWGPQQAHYCEMSYVAYMATGDVGFLEDLQYSANFTVLCDASFSLQVQKPVPHGEYRGVAWALRNLFMAHIATEDYEKRCAAAGLVFPHNLMPSSYYKTILDNSLAWYSKAMTDPAKQALRIVSGMVQAGTGSPDVLPPWQCDYMLTALAFGVLTGHSDWAPFYLWALKSAYDRMSGDDMPPGFGGPYYVNGASPNWKTAVLSGVPGLGGAEPATDDEKAKLNADPYNGGNALRGIWSMSNVRAALVMAQYLELKWRVPVASGGLGLAGPSPKDMYPKLDTCVNNVDRMFRNAEKDPLILFTMNPRASVVLDASQAPSVIPPPAPTPAPTPTPSPAPTPTPPPATGGTMTTILQGKSYILSPQITTPPGAVHYGVKPGTWALDKTDQATLTPAVNEQTATLMAKIDATAEDVKVTADVFTDVAKTQTITLSITLTDVLIAATAGTFSVTPVTSG